MSDIQLQVSEQFINERMDVAESEAAYGVGVAESEVRIKRHQYINYLISKCGGFFAYLLKKE